MSKTPTPQEIEELEASQAEHGPCLFRPALRAAREEIEQLRSRVQTCVECGGTLIWGPVVDQFARAEKAEATLAAHEKQEVAYLDTIRKQDDALAAKDAELAAVKVERDGYLTDCRTWAKEVDKLRESLARAEKALESIVVMASLGQQDSFKAEVTKQAREALKSGTNS